MSGVFSYDDPNIWRRLKPEVEAKLANCTEHLLRHRMATLEDYAHLMGQINAYREVLEIADNLNKTEQK